jgi:RNA polymerase sigma-70 factor (ECF subfamily)
MNTKTVLKADIALTGEQSFSRQELISIYEAYSPGLFRYAVRLLNDRDLAEDCVSETFSRFLKAVKKGAAPVENVQAYLYRIAHNWITDTYRRHPVPSLPLNPEIDTSLEANPSHTVTQELEAQQVRDALRKLPEVQQQVVHLRFLEDWSHGEIAALLGKTVEATRAIQYRALTTLRQVLLERDDEAHYER